MELESNNMLKNKNTSLTCLRPANIGSCGGSSARDFLWEPGVGEAKGVQPVPFPAAASFFLVPPRFALPRPFQRMKARTFWIQLRLWVVVGAPVLVVEAEDT